MNLKHSKLPDGRWELYELVPLRPGLPIVAFHFGTFLSEQETILLAHAINDSANKIKLTHRNVDSFEEVDGVHYVHVNVEFAKQIK